MCRVNGEEISRAGLAAPGLMLLVGGLIGVAFSEQAAAKLESLTDSNTGVPDKACYFN